MSRVGESPEEYPGEKYRQRVRISGKPGGSTACRDNLVYGTKATESASVFKNPHVLQSEFFLDRAGVILRLFLCQEAG